jgi:endonuclease YncB( thermonuclease family)
MILNKTVDVKSYGSDRNGRDLGVALLLNGKNINLEMVQVGLAEVYRGKPASGLDMGPYWKAEEEAKAANHLNKSIRAPEAARPVSSSRLNSLLALRFPPTALGLGADHSHAGRYAGFS